MAKSGTKHVNFFNLAATILELRLAVGTGSMFK
jgi:hypothetical protein